MANAIGKAANSEPTHSDLNSLALDALALVEKICWGYKQYSTKPNRDAALKMIEDHLKEAAGDS